MAVDAKYEDLWFTCQHPLESIHQRRDTNQSSRQNGLDRWHQQPLIDNTGPFILEGPEICPTKNKHVLQVWVCLSCLQHLSQNPYLNTNRGPPTWDPTQITGSTSQNRICLSLRLCDPLFVSHPASPTNSWLTGRIFCTIVLHGHSWVIGLYSQIGQIYP